jgi:Phosphodiester glycosidase
MAVTELAAAGPARRFRHEGTTVYVACHDAARTEVRVALVGDRLAPWCARHGFSEAIVGGFFTRPDGVPLGEVRTHGVAREHVSVEAPWHTVRACLHVEGGEARIARRDRIAAEPRGDLLQAGPLLVAAGEVAYDEERDDEGFRAAAHQFDPDPTVGRHPRAAIGLADGRLLAVVTDGRSAREAGLTLSQFAHLMLAFGCREALNLDGGGSAALISGGRLQNVPRRDHEVLEPGGRPLATALAFHAAG